MIKKIIACGDIHIRNLNRMEEYHEQFSKFFEQCKEAVEGYEKDEVRIVVTGDLFHNKLDISSEAYIMANWFLKNLSDIARTYIFSGNHDLNLKNLHRVSPIENVCSLVKYNDVIYLDKSLDYKSGCYVDDNVVFCLYSSFDKFSRPNIEEYKNTNDGDKVFVGLVHSDIKGSKTDVGYAPGNGLSTSYFEGLDVCLCGHIHKRQKLVYNDTDIIYTGSLIQQDHGENISGHGFIVWDTQDMSYEEYDVENDNYGYYTLQINGYNDIEENKEEIINL